MSEIIVSQDIYAKMQEKAMYYGQEPFKVQMPDEKYERKEVPIRVDKVYKTPTIIAKGEVAEILLESLFRI